MSVFQTEVVGSIPTTRSNPSLTLLAMITVYTKPNCPHCVKAKLLLQSHNYEFTELEVGKDVARETVLEKFPGVKMVPIIVVGDARIEGASELESLINNGQLGALL